MTQGNIDSGLALNINLAKVGLSPSYGSVISLTDGRLFWAWGTGASKDPLNPVYGNISNDRGKTWTDPFSLKLKGGGEVGGVFHLALIRLKSGKLGLTMTRTEGHSSFHLSEDEGETWSDAVEINPKDSSVFNTNDRAVVLSGGRIILPAYGTLSPKMLTPNPRQVFRYGEEFSEGSRYYLRFALAYYSDDEGKIWKRSRNETYAMIEKGMGGSYSMGESAVIELKDGRLMMIGRTNIGRFFRSFSDDLGETWSETDPTSLVCIPSPCSLTRIPETGDILVIWNQVSPFESMSGYYRHRLSCAVSKDDGETWQNHQNLESLDDTTLITDSPMESVVSRRFQQPTDRKRYHRAPGPLRMSYPTCSHIKGNAVITYGVSTFGDKNFIEKTFGIQYDDLIRKWGFSPQDRGNRLRVIPVDWFYG